MSAETLADKLARIRRNLTVGPMRDACMYCALDRNKLAIGTFCCQKMMVDINTDRIMAEIRPLVLDIINQCTSQSQIDQLKNSVVAVLKRLNKNKSVA